MGRWDLDRLTDDDSGGGFTPNYFQRSFRRRTEMPGVADPLSNIGGFNNQPDEKPLNSMTDTWEPPNKRRSRLSMQDFESGPAMIEYLKHVQSIPERQDYSPSIWHRLVGGLAGGVEGGTKGALAGIKGAEEVLNMPYRRALEDYEIKGSGLESAAKIEETKNAQRLKYHQYMLEQDEADRDRDVKWRERETATFNAETARKRAEFDAEIRKATNQTSIDRLTAQKAQWEKENELRLKQINVSSRQAGAAESNAVSSARRAGAYEKYVSRPPVTSQTQTGAARQMAEAEVKNAHMVDKEVPPTIDPRTGKPTTNPEPGYGVERAWFDAGGNLLPEFAEQFEREVQERMRRKLRASGFGDISMGADDSPVEDIDDWELEP